MARDIYADPFGSYIRGYDTGVQREMSLQKGVRDARDTDWSYYNMKPLELETAKRTNNLGREAYPWQVKMLPMGYEMARANLFDRQYNLAQYPAGYGVAEPAFQAMSNYYGMPYTGTNQEGFAFADASGQPIHAAQGAQGVLGTMPTMRAEQRAERTLDFNQDLGAQRLGLDWYNANRNADYNQRIVGVQEQNAANAAAVAAAKGGGGVPLYNPSPWFGGLPTTPAAAPAAPAANPAIAAAAAKNGMTIQQAMDVLAWYQAQQAGTPQAPPPIRIGGNSP